MPRFVDFEYLATGGSTTRTDPDRWVDNWIMLNEVGVDCTGTSDASTALQAAIDAAPDYSALILPKQANVRLDSTVTLTNRSGVVIGSFSNLRSQGTVNAPSFLWNGTGGTMFDIETSCNTLIHGLNFQINTGKSLDTFIKSDGQGGSVTSTTFTVRNCSFVSTQSNSSFKAISLCPTATSNNENSLIEHCYIDCSSTYAVKRATDGVINGTTALTSATASFVAGDEGKRVRVTYASGIHDTTIASVTNSTTAVMTDAAADSKTGATIHIDQAYGTGIYLGGASGQAKNTVFRNNQITHAARGIDVVQGSFSIQGLNGGTNDVGVYIAASTETSEIYMDQSETNFRAFYMENNSGSVVYRNCRIENSNAAADGFMYFEGSGRFSYLANNSATSIPTNAVHFGFGSVPTTPVIFSAGNNLQPLTIAQVNYGSVVQLVSLADVTDTNNFRNMMLGLPTSSAGLPTGALWANSGVVTVA